MSYIAGHMAKLYDKYTEVGNKNNKVVATVRPEILKKKFLELYAMTGHISKTCDILGMVRRTVTHWRHNDPQFEKDFQEADKEALALLEDEAVRRAMYGVDKPVYQAGKLVGFTKEYSDTLLIVLLKSRSKKYIDKFAGELTGANGQPLTGEVKVIHVHSSTPLAGSEDEVDTTRVIQEIPYEMVPANPNKPNDDEILNEIK